MKRFNFIPLLGWGFGVVLSLSTVHPTRQFYIWQSVTGACMIGLGFFIPWLIERTK